MSDTELRQKVRKLLLFNTREGYSKQVGGHFCYVKPSPDTYPYQYFWDTCFHVFMLCALGEYELAKKNMKSLFAVQEQDGFVGHMIFWSEKVPNRVTDVFQAKPVTKRHKPHMSALIQPPLAAAAVLRIYDDTKDEKFLKVMLPKLKKYHRWLLKRDFEGEGLLSIISPFESGIDWKASFDDVLGYKGKAGPSLFFKAVWVDARNFFRNYNLTKIYKANYFIVKEVGFNTFYARDLLALSKLCGYLKDKDSEMYKKMAARTGKRILEVMYDKKKKAFLDVYGKENKKLPTLTPTIFYPVVLPEVPRTIGETVIKAHLLNSHEFNTPYPVPSVAVSSPSFNAKESLFIWRGPAWPVFDWYLYHSLQEKGFTKLAEKLLQSVRSLIEKSGFREYYDPYTGEGYGAKGFTWSGLIVDMMDEKRHPRLV